VLGYANDVAALFFWEGKKIPLVILIPEVYHPSWTEIQKADEMLSRAKVSSNPKRSEDVEKHNRSRLENKREKKI
jgi:hypothetical protein